MRRIKNIQNGQLDPCLGNDGSKICPCGNWSGAIMRLKGRLVGPFECERGRSHEAPSQREARMKKSKKSP